MSSHTNEILIAVMGATGSGKSTFINLISRSSLAVGNDLVSCTSRVAMANIFEYSGRMVTFIDTPGFDDTTVSDTDILKMIADYLSRTYASGRKLSGVIYMHRICDVRFTGITKRNFNMFRKLCGDETLKNVVIVTTFWSQVELAVGEARESQLKASDEFFKPVLDQGATMLRHDSTERTALNILQSFVNNHPQPLCIQRELVDQYRHISETSAGVELGREFAEMEKKHKKDLEQVSREMNEALLQKDIKTKTELDEVRRSLMNDIARIEEERDRLSRKYECDDEESDGFVAGVAGFVAGFVSTVTVLSAV